MPEGEQKKKNQAEPAPGKKGRKKTGQQKAAPPADDSRFDATPDVLPAPGPPALPELIVPERAPPRAAFPGASDMEVPEAVITGAAPAEEPLPIGFPGAEGLNVDGEAALEYGFPGASDLPLVPAEPFGLGFPGAEGLDVTGEAALEFGFPGASGLPVGQPGLERAPDEEADPIFAADRGLPGTGLSAQAFPGSNLNSPEVKIEDNGRSAAAGFDPAAEAFPGGGEPDDDPGRFPGSLKGS